MEKRLTGNFSGGYVLRLLLQKLRDAAIILSCIYNVLLIMTRDLRLDGVYFK